MKKFSFKTASRELTVEKRAQREQMMRALPDELLAQIRGGMEEACHVSVCCCTGCNLAV